MEFTETQRRELLLAAEQRWHRLDRDRRGLSPKAQQPYIEQQQALADAMDELRR